MSCICDICELKLSHIKNMTKHQSTEKCQTIKRLLDKKEYMYINKNKKLEQEIIRLNDINIQNSININNLLVKLECLKQELLTKEIQLKETSNKYEDLKKIVEKAATKSTNTFKNYTHNNYLNYISTEPIKFNELKSQVKQLVNCETIMYDDTDFHNHIVDNILKDKSGKDKVLCTDINRKNFTYKDEISGELISDPELENLRDQLKKGTDIRKIRRNLLEKLVNEYEENGSVGVDPYKHFSDIIQKLNFGTPFVDHVAKKTYVKSKIGNNNQIEEYDIENNYITDSKSIILSDLEEKEYQELLSEFGEE